MVSLKLQCNVHRLNTSPIFLEYKFRLGDNSYLIKLISLTEATNLNLMSSKSGMNTVLLTTW